MPSSLAEHSPLLLKFAFGLSNPSSMGCSALRRSVLIYVGLLEGLLQESYPQSLTLQMRQRLYIWYDQAGIAQHHDPISVLFSLTGAGRLERNLEKIIGTASSPACSRKYQLIRTSQANGVPDSCIRGSNK